MTLIIQLIAGADMQQQIAVIAVLVDLLDDAVVQMLAQQHDETARIIAAAELALRQSDPVVIAVKGDQKIRPLTVREDLKDDLCRAEFTDLVDAHRQRCVELFLDAGKNDSV